MRLDTVLRRGSSKSFWRGSEGTWRLGDVVKLHLPMLGRELLDAIVFDESVPMSHVNLRSDLVGST